MLLYFSATGNSKYVATRIAKETNERMVSIVECCNSKRYSFSLQEGEAFGIVAPTYYFGLPSIVEGFLSKIRFTSVNDPYIYFVATYGTTPGQTATYANTYLEEKGSTLSASYSVKMPDTWTPIFNLTDREKVQRINEKAESQIDAIIDHIKSTERGNFMKARLPMFAVKLYRPNYEKRRQTKYFTVEDSCIGCGLCENLCPDHAIEIHSKRPVWVKDQCVMCLGCLHRCPEFSIQYGTKTKKHGQYLNPYVKVSDLREGGIKI